MKTNYMRNAPYIRNRALPDRNFLVHICKMMIAPGFHFFFFFDFFKIFVFWAIRGVKEQNMAQNKK